MKVTRWDYYHFRTRNGAEVDLVLEDSFGLLPIEIKIGRRTRLKQLEGLRRFIARHELPFLPPIPGLAREVCAAPTARTPGRSPYPSSS